MSWFGFGKKSSDRMLVECLSNLALAVIGEGWRVKDDFLLTTFYDSEMSVFFDKLEEISSDLDQLFIAQLKTLPLTGDKYVVVLRHFDYFKQANLNPIFGTLIIDKKLKNLLIKEVMVKLTSDMSISETRKWRNYHYGVLDFLGVVISKLRNSFYDYENDIAKAFAASAVKLNVCDLSWQDCSYFTEPRFSKPLITILGEHYKQINAFYNSLI